MYCSSCATQIESGFDFCSKCGKQVGVSKSKVPSGVTAALVGALTVLLVAAAWFANDLRQKKKASNQSALNESSVLVSLSPEEIYQRESPGMILVETYDNDGRKRGLGSGFVVSSDGTAITNYRVIRGASRATVKFSDGTVGSVSGVASYDQIRDIAVIRVTPSPKTVAEIGDSDKVRVGDKVVAIGSPLGLQNTMSVGIVSALRNGVIQMSDPISPGSSGGAVFDEHGKVVGVAVAQMVVGQNLNFALPINWAKPYLNGQSPRALSDIVAENAVTENLIDGSVTVPQAQARTWNITVDANKISNAEVHGQVSSSGGMGGKITVALYFQKQQIFTCRGTSCEIHQAITNPGVYTLVLDNRISPIFARTVTGQVSFRYVR